MPALAVAYPVLAHLSVIWPRPWLQWLALAVLCALPLFGGLLLVLLIAAGASPGFRGGSLSPEGLLVFIVAALRIMAPLKAITQFPGQMAQALASAERVFDILGLPAAELEHDGLAPARFEREIRFEEVGFRYAADAAPVLEGISFTITRGQTVALVGPSGAGKTTMAELLPRLREPTAGRILLDDAPLATLDDRLAQAPGPRCEFLTPAA